VSLWYIGDPCYAIDDNTWGEFCELIYKQESGLEGEGIEFDWEQHRVYVYNSGLGGDGSISLGEHKLSVDAGLLSVLPLEVCRRLSDAEKTEGEHGSHSIIESYYRPVFSISTDEFPHVTLEYTTFTDGVGRQNITISDTADHNECDECGEWIHTNNMVWTNHQGAVGYDCCYEEEVNDDDEEE
jgi:hypothetical protein